MKKTLLTLALVGLTIGAYAQGKVSFGNDSNHYFVLGDTLAADAALGGGVQSTAGNTVSGTVGAIPMSPLPSGVNLIAGLAAVTGVTTEASALQMKTTYVLSGGNWFQAGRMTSRGIALAGVPGGSIATLAVYVWDAAYATPAEAALQSYYGTSGLFTMTPGASIAYPSITTAGGTTWAPNNLVISVIPEPSTFALAGLGAAAMLIFRRRRM